MTLTMTYTMSHQLWDRARQVIPGGVNSKFRSGAIPFPLFYERASGAHLWDEDGNRYIDYFMGQGPLLLGHSPPSLSEAVSTAMSEGQLYAGQHRLEVAVAEKLVELLPSADQVRFSNSGTEAVQAAIRLARAYTGRRIVVKFEGHYHGWMDNILVSVLPPAEDAGDARNPTPVLGSEGQSSSVLDEIIPLPWNDASVVKQTLERRSDQIAAVLMTPVMTTRAIIPPKEGYIQEVRRLCNRHDVLLILDEVHTGFRIHPQGAQGLFGVEADLTVLGKALANGFPISALAGPEPIMRLIGEGRVDHSGTFNGNVVSMAAAMATLEALLAESEKVYDQVETRGGRLMEGIRHLSQERELDLAIQGFPALFSMSFTPLPRIENYRDCLKNDVRRYQELVGGLMDRGIRTTERGVWYLSAAHTDADIDETLAVLERILD